MESTDDESATDCPPQTSGTKKQKTWHYTHKYQHAWETNAEYKKWIGRSMLGNLYFYCKSCLRDCKGGLSAVKKHQSSKLHTQSMKNVKVNSVFEMASVKRSISSVREVKVTEIRIASFIAEHNLPINAVDHLVGLIKSIKLENKDLDKLSCNRTKCTTLINNVIGSTGFDNVLNIMKVHTFSMLVDESTDHSCIKHLAIVIRTCINFVVTDSFVTLLPLANATSKNMYDVITAFFNEHNVPYKDNLIGFASDGANSMMGVNNSLQTMLKKDVPKLFILKCVCHSLALCADNACKKLPTNVENMIRSIYTYFQQSFKRQKEYESFQVFWSIKPHKLLQLSGTRWLSLLAVVQRVLEQYKALKSYFQLEKFNDVQNGINISNYFDDPKNQLYLEFLCFILPTIVDVNLEFQSETPKLYLLYNRIASAYKFILQCYIKPNILNHTDIAALQYRNPENYLPSEEIYLGPKVAVALENNVLTRQDTEKFQTDCLNFLVECARQIYIRFPFNSNEVISLKHMAFLDLKNIKNTPTLGLISRFFPHLMNNPNELDREWRLFISDIKIDKDQPVLTFWKDNLSKIKGDETLMYPELQQFITGLLSLPHSSACVERVFSAVNLNKTKLRNRLSTETLCGLLLSKQLIHESKNQVCYNYDIKDSTIDKHNGGIYLNTKQKD